MGTMTFGPAFWALAVLALAAASTYGTVFLRGRPSLLRAAAKTLFMAGASGALISAEAPSPLVLAAIASAFGDLFLAFNRKWLLPFGILSFLIAQLAYLLIFFFSWMFAGDISPLWPRYAALVILLFATLSFLVWIGPKLGWMALAVAPYALAITAMAAAAMWLPWVGWPAMAGALLFLLSDFVLAAELFRLPPDAAARRITAPIVWWTYVAAQVLIIVGVILLMRAS